VAAAHHLAEPAWPATLTAAGVTKRRSRGRVLVVICANQTGAAITAVRRPRTRGLLNEVRHRGTSASDVSGCVAPGMNDSKGEDDGNSSAA
jgi:hypothetical protein